MNTQFKYAEHKGMVSLTTSILFSQLNVHRLGYTMHMFMESSIMLLSSIVKICLIPPIGLLLLKVLHNTALLHNLYTEIISST